MDTFLDIKYLQFGNQRQQLAFKELLQLDIIHILDEFHPLLAGTIPIGIDIPNSDLDIICECRNFQKLRDIATQHFQHLEGFHIHQKSIHDTDSLIIRFRGTYFDIEIFAQDIPSQLQHAFRHMLIEHQILQKEGEVFLQKVIDLKLQGIKTEPAFAQLLGLEGNPYQALLAYEY